MIVKSLIAFVLIGTMPIGFFGRDSLGLGRREGETLVTGYFEGHEPFWEMEIKDNLFMLYCVNDTEKDTLNLSEKQAHTETYAFQSKELFGIIRKSNGGCNLDITEEENPTHEIYFNYQGRTYMGCGKMKVQ